MVEVLFFLLLSIMETDKFYHIYNRTNNKELLFKEDINYFYFLNQFKKYISPISDVYAYCLIPNHFHFVLKIKESSHLERFFEAKLEKAKTKSQDLQGFENLGGLKLISQQFSNLFNSYTKSINKKYNRNGSLFAQNFKKKEINTEKYLQQVILYVHLNPFFHAVSDDFESYLHSSYNSIISLKTTELKRKEVIDLFGDKQNFIFMHQKRKLDEEMLSSIMEEDE